jgi:response regulator RpfG family c-di-GMP phosphodiesterase
MDADRILIVDDDPELLTLLRTGLSKSGYLVDVESTGDAGYERLKTGSYCACLLDIKLSGLNGLEVLTKARKDHDMLTPVIMMTGGTDAGIVVDLMRLGAEDYLQKPFRMEEVRQSVQRACSIRKIQVENLKQRRFLEHEFEKKTEHIRRSYYDVVQAFASSIELRDPNTGGHTRRVSELSVLFASGMGFQGEKLDEFRIGGLLHDIGKIGIRDSVLQKPGRLTEDEFEEMRRHPLIGEQIVTRIGTMRPMVPYILSHHERYDGKGYPHGLSGTSIPVEGRIVALADAFDAMVSDRVYRRRKRIEEAYDEVVANSGTQFDPDVVEVFRDLWDHSILQNVRTVGVMCPAERMRTDSEAIFAGG